MAVGSIAGALAAARQAKPRTALLLSAASDWRWGLTRADNPWYASLRIERQERLMDWRPVLARVRNCLAEHVHA